MKKILWKEIEKIIYRTGKSWGPEEQMSYEEYLAREIELFIYQELDKAREEVLLELLEKKTNYKIERVDHGYKVTQEYVLVSDIEKELSKLKTKDDEK